MRFLAIAAAAPLLLALAPPPGVPQKKLTIERIFASPPISGPTPRSLKLSPDGRYASLLLPCSTDRERYDLWAMDTTTGAKRMLLDSTKVGGGEISEAEKMRRERNRVGGTKGIVEYEWAPNGQSVSVHTGRSSPDAAVARTPSPDRNIQTAATAQASATPAMIATSLLVRRMLPLQRSR